MQHSLLEHLSCTVIVFSEGKIITHLKCALRAVRKKFKLAPKFFALVGMHFKYYVMSSYITFTVGLKCQVQCLNVELYHILLLII